MYLLALDVIAQRRTYIGYSSILSDLLNYVHSRERNNATASHDVVWRWDGLKLTTTPLSPLMSDRAYHIFDVEHIDDITD